MEHTDTERLDYLINTDAIVDNWKLGWKVVDWGYYYDLSEPGKYFTTAREAIDSAIDRSGS